MSELESFRTEKNSFFATDPQSPLTQEQKREFNGLVYFPENEDLKLEVSVERFPHPETIQMQTSTNDVQTYQRYGRFQFKIDGQDAALTIYHSHGDFFLPFVDSQAGSDTYGAGRYLEPQPVDKDHFLIDFNYAYNPYCAYNENWSCPITPADNRLKVPIRAGEKVFHE
jgi:uncharacterized protein